MSSFNVVNIGSTVVGTVTGKRTNTVGSERVTLRPKMGINSFSNDSPLLKPLIATNGLMFPYRPTITWQQNIVYGTQQLTHTLQDFKYFIRNSSVTFNISCPFTCENTDTASYTLAALHFLRSASKMHFGGFNGSSTSSSIVSSLLTTTTSTVSNDSYVGLPPTPLVLNGYGDYMFNNLNVILENFSMNFSDEVDYVDFTINGSKLYFPVLSTLVLQVTTQNTPQKTREFNHADFVNGSLMKKGGWF